MPQIELNGTVLEYLEEGEGQPVVFIHGSASDYRVWQNQMNWEKSKFRRICYSRRFHWPNQPIADDLDYSMREHVNDLKGLLNALRIKPAHIVGHSYGALMALELACEEPEYVQKLVLVEPPGITLFVENSNSPKPLELLKLLLSRPRTGFAVIKLGAGGLGPAAKAAHQGDMKKALSLFGKAALGPETFNQMSTERKEQALANLTKAELTGSGFLPLNEEKLRQLHKPISLVTGEKSPRVFGCLVDRLEELLPECERVEIAGASHIVQVDNPKQFNEILFPYLEKH